MMAITRLAARRSHDSCLLSRHARRSGTRPAPVPGRLCHRGPLGRHARPERGGPPSAQSGAGGRPAVGADCGRPQRPLRRRGEPVPHVVRAGQLQRLDQGAFRHSQGGRRIRSLPDVLRGERRRRALAQAAVRPLPLPRLRAHQHRADRPRTVPGVLGHPDASADGRPWPLHVRVQGRRPPRIRAGRPQRLPGQGRGLPRLQRRRRRLAHLRGQPAASGAGQQVQPLLGRAGRALDHERPSVRARRHRAAPGAHRPRVAQRPGADPGRRNRRGRGGARQRGGRHRRHRPRRRGGERAHPHQHPRQSRPEDLVPAARGADAGRRGRRRADVLRPHDHAAVRLAVPGLPGRAAARRHRAFLDRAHRQPGRHALAPAARPKAVPAARPGGKLGRRSRLGAPRRDPVRGVALHVLLRVLAAVALPLPGQQPLHRAGAYPARPLRRLPRRRHRRPPAVARGQGRRAAAAGELLRRAPRLQPRVAWIVAH